MANTLTPRQIIEEYSQRFIDAFQESIQKHERLASGELWQSVKANIKVFGQTLVLEISMEDYWKYVDGGRKAGGKMPPLAPMLKHIADRGQRWNPVAQTISKQYKDKKGKVTIRKKPLDMNTARKTLAFLIGRSIKKHGIKPTHFASEVMDSNLLDEFKKDITIAVGRNIKIEINRDIKQ